MTQMLANHPNIARKLCTEPLYRHKRLKQGRPGLMDYVGSWRKAGQSGELMSEKLWHLARQRGFMVQCCSSSTAEETGLTTGNGKSEIINGEGQFGYLVSEYGWKVRRLVEMGDEMRKAAQVQAEAFHVPVALFDDLFFQFFQAEVLAGLVYKIRNSPPDRYACLIAEPTTTNASDSSQQELVGVVDATVSRDKTVLQHLPFGVEEYLYVSGIAVLGSFRRQKIATVLLKACDMLSLLWGSEYLALWAYEDDLGARKLYTNAGYQVVSGDPLWLTTWIGRKRRVLLVKRSNPTESNLQSKS